MITHALCSLTLCVRRPCADPLALPAASGERVREQQQHTAMHQQLLELPLAAPALKPGKKSKDGASAPPLGGGEALVLTKLKAVCAGGA